MRKYRNVPTVYNGRRYDSTKEAKYAMLLDMARLAEKKEDRVVAWFPQVSFRLSTGNRIIVDFMVCYANGRWELHDVKGWDKNKKKWVTKTYIYNLKKRMLKQEYGIEIREV